MRFLLLLLSLPAVYGGQSLDISSGNYCTMSDPNVATSADWRVEFQLHDFSTPASNRTLFYLNGLGLELESRTDGTILVQDKRDTVSGTTSISTTGRTNILVRIQRNHTGATFTVETWDIDSTNYAISTGTITSENSWAFSGGGVGGATSPTASIAYLRIWSTLVSLRSKPPTTAPSGTTALHLKFDGNLNDSGPNGRNCTGTGSIAYRTTPIGNIVYPIPKTSGAPIWTNSLPCRAGANCTLDGSDSYSLADASDTVTYFWNQLSGPSTALWDSHTSATPTLSGLTFGPYSIILRATDAAGTAASATLGVGAVSTDSNNIVVNADPAADKIFGPMMAYGSNPWTFADEKRWDAAVARAAGGESAYTTPLWLTNLVGTISYTPSSSGTSIQTTLNGSITDTATSIVLTDASVLDWSSLPTIIFLHAPGNYNTKEQIRICNRSGNTLTPCYDGRAWRRGTYEQVTAPAAWASGTVVRQIKTTGTSTAFLTDFCPAGAGEAGSVYYSTGTVSVTAGSATLTGSGTAWTSAFESRRIRISGTYSTGTPFVFFSSVSGAPASGTSLTLARVWPADADSASGLSYAVLDVDKQYISRSWVRGDATTGRQLEAISSCESNTAMYHTEIFSGQSGAQTAQNYAIGEAWVSDFGPSYYDEPLAHYAGYFASGLQTFLDNARTLGDVWMKQPGLDEGYLNNQPRRLSLIGQFAAAVLDGRTDNWYGLRKIVDAVKTGNAVGGSCEADIRETAYMQAWIALDAMLDPDSSRRTTLQAVLQDIYTRDNNCKNPQSGAIFDSGYTTANSFPTAYFGGSGSYTISGSAVTGTGFTSDICAKVASGSGLALTAGQTVITGHSGFVDQSSNGKIVIFAQRGGNPYMFYSLFTYVSSSAITLSSPFDGTSGTYSWQIESDTKWLQFASNNTDYANLGRLYTCTFNDSTSLTLDRAFEGSNGTYAGYRAVEVGYGTQPFLLGIKVMALRYAAAAATGSTATNLNSLANAAATWILTQGFDTVTKGLHYARGWRGCEPANNPRMNCSYDNTSFSRQEAARTLNGEAQNAMRMVYEADPSAANLEFGDEFYGAQWGKYGGPWSDGVYIAAMDDADHWDYKWLGFSFGIGMAHQWPAVRLGGVAAESLKTYQYGFVLPSGADKIQVTIKRPSGEEVNPATCTTSPCTFTYDTRQGRHLIKHTYLTTGGAVRGISEWREIQ